MRDIWNSSSFITYLPIAVCKLGWKNRDGGVASDLNLQCYISRMSAQFAHNTAKQIINNNHVCIVFLATHPTLVNILQEYKKRKI